MNVKAVSITKSLIEEKPLTAEELLVYQARVSNPDNQLNTETAPKLLSFLIREAHWSPYEMCDFGVEITTRRSIAQQIIRHKSFCFQEWSTRYSQVNSVEPIELRKQAIKNRQSSEEVIDPLIRDYQEGGSFMDASVVVNNLLADAQFVYQNLIDAGVAKECARDVLPLATTTKLYMKGSIRSWLGYFNVRLHKTTQKEHRDIALEIAKLLAHYFPDIATATNNFNNYEGKFM